MATGLYYRGFVAEKSAPSAMFIGEDSCTHLPYTGTARTEQFTVIGEEAFVKVISNGRVGYMRRDDVEMMSTPERSASVETMDERRQAVKRLAKAKLKDFPDFERPESKKNVDAPEYMGRLEEAVHAGFPVPRTLERRITSLAEVVQAALARPGGVRTCVALIRWGASAPDLAREVAPFLPELPTEARDAFRSLAPQFLEQRFKDRNAAATWLALFRSALGLPPTDAQDTFLSDARRALHQPYGGINEDANFHPPPLSEDDFRWVMDMLGKKKGESTDAVFTRLCHARGAAGMGSTGDEGENSKELVFVGSTMENVSNLCKVLQSPTPLLIEGGTGVGKTVSVCAAAERLGSELIRYNLSSNTTVQDLVGRLEFGDDRRLRLSDQPFTRAFREGLILVLDECNLAQEEVLSTLETAIDTGILTISDPSNPARASRSIRRHPAFRLIITQNPCTGLFAGKRNKLSEAFLSRFQPLKLLDLTDDDIAQIAAHKFTQYVGDGGVGDWRPLGRKVCGVHREVSQFAMTEGEEQATTVFSCRDIINMVKLLALQTRTLPAGKQSLSDKIACASATFLETAWCIYGVRFMQGDAQQKVCDIIIRVADISRTTTIDGPAGMNARILSAPSLAPALPEVGECVQPGALFAHSPLPHPLVVTPRMLAVWKKIDYVMALGRPVLLIGSTGAGVTSAAVGFATYRTGGDYLLSEVTGDTTVGGLVGQMVPSFANDEEDDVKSDGAPQVARWVDGPVTSAMEQGKWLVLDDLASAEATVLERLNSVLEEKPELYVSERGEGAKNIDAHPNFKVLATANINQIADLSPAFANRFNIIVYPSGEDDQAEEIKLVVSRLLFSPRTVSIVRCGPDIATETDGHRFIVRKSRRSAYSAAVLSMVLVREVSWRVTIGSTGVNGMCVGVCVNDASLDVADEPFESNSMWIYSSVGQLVQTSDADKRVGKRVERFDGGDVITVKVDIDKLTIGFSKNGVHQGDLNLATKRGRSAVSKAAGNEDAPRLRPYIALYTKGSSATIELVSGEDVAQGAVAGAVSMCLRMAKDKGVYGVAAAVRAVCCTRTMATGVRLTAGHLRRAIGFINDLHVGGEKAEGEAEDELERKGSYLVFSKRMRGNAGLQAVAALSRMQRMQPSLLPMQDRVRWCRAARVPVLIVDDHHWGFARAAFAGGEYVVATEQSTITEWLGSILPTCTHDGVKLRRVPGPLLRGLGLNHATDAGTSFVVERIHSLSGTVQAQLCVLLERGMLPRDGEGRPETAGSDFYLAGVCQAEDVQKLNKKLRAHFVQVRLPVPRAADYLALMHEPDVGVAGEENRRIALAAELLTDREDLPMDLQIFTQVLKRMACLVASHKDMTRPAWWALCYTNLLQQSCAFAEDVEALAERLLCVFVKADVLPADGVEAFEAIMHEPAAVAQKGDSVAFTAHGMTCSVKGALRHGERAPTLTPGLLAALTAVAQHAAVGEALVLAGPTSCKTLAVECYAAISEQEVDPIHLTCAHDEADLLGGIHPYSQQELREVVERERALLGAREAQHPHDLDGWRRMIDALVDGASGLDTTDRGLTYFAFRDGPLTTAVKRGDGILLKSANLPRQELYSALGDLLRRQVLPLGLVSPVGHPVPLKPRVPLVLTVTCSAYAALPQPLSALAVKRCAEYSAGELRGIMLDRIARRHADPHIDDLLVKSIPTLFAGEALKAQLRMADFAAEYCTVAGISKPAALMLGRHLLMHASFSDAERTQLQELGWSDAQIDDVAAALPDTTAAPAESPVIRDYIAFDPTTAKVCIKDSTQQKTLCVAVAHAPGSFTRRVEDTEMVATPSLLKNLASIFAASTMRVPLLLEGAPGIGKSFIVQSAAQLLGAEFRRVQFSAGTTIAHLYGAMMPAIEDGVRCFKRKEGSIGEALALARADRRREVWMLLDELNLAPPEVQQRISELLQPSDDRENVRVFAAINPAAIGGGRSHLPPSVRDLFASIRLNPLTMAEELKIATAKFRRRLDVDAALEGVLLTQLQHIHRRIGDDIAAGELGRERGAGSTYPVNLRTLEKVVLLLEARLARGGEGQSLKLPPTQHEAIKRFFLQVLEVIYCWRFPTAADVARARAVLALVAKEIRAAVPAHPAIASVGRGHVIVFGEAAMLRGASASESHPLPPSGDLRSKLTALATAGGSSLAVLLEGPTGSGKTALVRELARICGQKLRVISITPTTEVGELLGSWVPWSGVGAAGSDLCKSLLDEVVRLAAAFVADPDSPPEAEAVAQSLLTLLRDSPTGATLRACARDMAGKLEVTDRGRLIARSIRRVLQLLDDNDSAQSDKLSFHFAESQLLHAMQDGDWVLMDNIDWGPPAAVERLNSLLEADPSFTLLERGEKDEMELRKRRGIHANFRMFFTSNPQRKHAAKLSEAFMNRVVRMVLRPLEGHVTTGKAVDVGEVTSALPNVVFASISPKSVDIRIWQYLLTMFYRRLLELDPSLCVRTLQHCLVKWREDLITHGQQMGPLVPLCSTLLQTFEGMTAAHVGRKDLLRVLRTTLAEAWVLRGATARREAARRRAEERRQTADRERRRREDAAKDAQDTGTESEDDNALDEPEEKEPELKANSAKNKKALDYTSDGKDEEKEGHAPQPDSVFDSDSDSDSEIQPSSDDGNSGDYDVSGEADSQNGDVEMDFGGVNELAKVREQMQQCLSLLDNVGGVGAVGPHGGEGVAADNEDGINDLAKHIRRMWEAKSCGFIDELLSNLKAPQGKTPADTIQAILTRCKEKAGDLLTRFPRLTVAHLIAATLYSMEGPDIDRLLGFEDAPTWSPTDTTAQENWTAYKKQHAGLRNPTIYGDMNWSLRTALAAAGDDRVSALSKLQEWVKFIGVIMTMVDELDGSHTLFRAISKVDPKVVDGYRVEAGQTKVAAWAAPNSCSRRQLDNFMVKTEDKKPDTGENMMFVLRGVRRGLPMGRLSAYPEEEEILLPPFVTLDVVPGTMTTKSRGPREWVQVELSVRQYTFWDAPEHASFLSAVLADCKGSARDLEAVVMGHTHTHGMLIGLSADREFPEAWAAELVGAARAKPPASDVYATTDNRTDGEGRKPAKLLDVLAFAEANTARYAERVLRKKIQSKAVEAYFTSYCPGEATVEALGSLLPNNVFTRYEAASSGAELYIPGLIKAISTNFTYSKVFASKTAGGARSYGCVILFDAACCKLDNPAAKLYLDLFAELRTGLASCDLDPTVLLKMGSEAQCVHLRGAWSRASTHAMLTHLHVAAQAEEASPRQGAALQLAVSLAAALKGVHRHVFFMSPGGGLAGDSSMAEALKLAEDKGISVLGIGTSRGIHSAVPCAVSVSDPADLGRGLARYLTGPHAERPQANPQNAEKEREEMFWGLCRNTVVDAYMARKGGIGTSLALGHEVHRLGTVTWTVLVKGAECSIGFGTSFLGVNQDLGDLSPSCGVAVPVPPGQYNITVDLTRREYVIASVDGRQLNKDTALPADVDDVQLLFGTTGSGHGECMVLNTDNPAGEVGAWHLSNGVRRDVVNKVPHVVLDGKGEAFMFGMDMPAGGGGPVMYNLVPPVDGAGVRMRYMVIPTTALDRHFETAPTKDSVLSDAGGAYPSGDVGRGQQLLYEADADTGVVRFKMQGTVGGGDAAQWADLPQEPFTLLMRIHVDRPQRGGAAGVIAIQEVTPMRPFTSPVAFEVPITNPQVTALPVEYGASQFLVQHGTGSASLTFDVCDRATKAPADTTPLEIQPDRVTLGNESVPFETGGAIAVLVDVAGAVVKYRVCTTAGAAITEGRLLEQPIQPRSIVVPSLTVAAPGNTMRVARMAVTPEAFSDGAGWAAVGAGLNVVSHYRVERTAGGSGRTEYANAMRRALDRRMHRWTMKLGATDTLKGAVVGIATQTFSIENKPYRREETWVLTASGVASHGAVTTSHKKWTGKNVAVTVAVDMAGDRVPVFWVDGEKQDVTFDPIPEEVVVCPLVGLLGQGQHAVYEQDVEEEGSARKVPWVWNEVNDKRDALPSSDYAAMGSSGLEFRLRSQPGDTAFHSVYGPEIRAGGEYSWEYCLNASSGAGLCGVTVGVARLPDGEPASAEDVSQAPYQHDNRWVYTNHGTIGHGDVSSRLNDTFSGEAAAIVVSMHRRELSFTLAVGETKRTQGTKLSLGNDDDMLVRPMLCWYDGALRAEVLGKQNFSPVQGTSGTRDVMSARLGEAMPMGDQWAEGKSAREELPPLASRDTGGYVPEIQQTDRPAPSDTYGASASALPSGARDASPRGL